MVLNALGLETQSVVPEAELDRPCPFSSTKTCAENEIGQHSMEAFAKIHETPSPPPSQFQGGKEACGGPCLKRISMCWD
eukprot:4950263-Amphidinium_carterae.1